MSKENFERFMKQVDDSQDLQAKIGAAITGEALVALGAAHGCEFSIADVQAGAELSDAALEGVSGGATRRRSKKSFSFSWRGQGGIEQMGGEHCGGMGVDQTDTKYQ